MAPSTGAAVGCCTGLAVAQGPSLPGVEEGARRRHSGSDVDGERASAVPDLGPRCLPGVLEGGATGGTVSLQFGPSLISSRDTFGKTVVSLAIYHHL
ncbi:hypothetical protein LZ32DRAFT_661946 [Colletotrichum eremochloae]|nr:hypothetical protein LZ32DRAFT_661946 [Colletotrichum eremochloae]